MITRGKSCFRRGNLSTFLDNVVVPASNEPLTFLYPPLAKATLLQRQSPASRASFSNNRRLKTRKTFAGFPSQQNQSVSTEAHNRWLSQERHTSNVALRTEKSDSIALPDSSQAATPQRPKEDGNRSVDSTRKSPHGLEVQSQNETESSNSPTDTALDSSTNKNESTTQENIPIRRTLTVTPSLADHKRIAAKRRQNELSAQVHSRGDLNKLKYRKYIQLRHRNINRMTPPHWTELMAQLERIRDEMPAEPKKGKVKELLVREETIALISGSTIASENVWYVRIRNGCRVHVLDTIESEGIYRKVMLSGSGRAVELVEKQIKQIDEQQRQSGSVPVVPSMLALSEKGEPVPLIRGVWTDTKPKTMEQPMSNLFSETRSSSIRGFTQLISQLVRLPDMDKSPSPSDRWSTDKVRDQLVAIFGDSTNRPYLSAHAVNLALTFLCEHEYLSSARIVCRKAQLVATVDTYNVLLRSTAKRQDVWFFQAVLTDMQQSRIQPSGKTWLALLKFLVSQGPRHQVMLRMGELGFLEDKRVLHDVIEYNIPMMISSHLEKGLDVQFFVDSLEQNWGSHVITTATLNQIIGPIAQRQDPKLLQEALECFERFELALDSTTFDLVLPSFRRFHSMHKVISRYLADEHLLNERHYELLFVKAISSNAYNTCRVIWRYACMRDATSPLMRKLVRLSLAGKNRGTGNDPERLNYHIGAIVVGLEYRHGIQPSGKASSMVSAHHAENPLVYFILNKEGLADDEKSKLVSQLVADDIVQGRRRRPALSFGLMLEAAMKLDQEARWHSPDAGNPGVRKLPTIDILKQVIDVPIE